MQITIEAIKFSSISAPVRRRSGHSMIRYFLIIFVLVVFSSCKTDDINKSTEILKTEQSVMNAANLHKIIGLEATTDTTSLFNGEYSYIQNGSADRQLHGPFHFSYADSGSYEDIIFKIDIEYSGSFNRGKPIELTQRYLNDDGVDNYSNWNTILHFDSLTGKCNLAKFHGKIGYEMQDTTFEFLNPDTCSFRWIVYKAWALWEQEWERRKNAH